MRYNNIFEFGSGVLRFTDYRKTDKPTSKSNHFILCPQGRFMDDQKFKN